MENGQKTYHSIPSTPAHSRETAKKTKNKQMKLIKKRKKHLEFFLFKSSLHFEAIIWAFTLLTIDFTLARIVHLF